MWLNYFPSEGMVKVWCRVLGSTASIYFQFCRRKDGIAIISLLTGGWDSQLSRKIDECCSGVQGPVAVGPVTAGSRSCSPPGAQCPGTQWSPRGVCGRGLGREEIGIMHRGVISDSNRGGQLPPPARYVLSSKNSHIFPINFYSNFWYYKSNIGKKNI